VTSLGDRPPPERAGRQQDPEETGDHFGWFAHFAALDCPASSQRTRELLGWRPKQPGLIPDLDRPRYFETFHVSTGKDQHNE
jgi:hypothetical protein